MKIIRDSPNVDGSKHGGVHRSSQIRDVLRSTGFPFLEVHPFDYEPSKVKRFLAALRFISRYGYPFSWRPWSFRYLGTYYSAYRRRLAPIQEEATYLWETTSDLLGFIAAREKGFRIIAMPQNLESLIGAGPIAVRGPVLDCLAHEVRYFKECAQVFCISREEQWLLRNLGISADYLPYYPTGDHCQRLLAIRDKRTNHPPKRANYLILGSANYRPSRVGMERLLDHLASLPSFGATAYHVAGNGTEVLQERVRRWPNVVVHGFVPSDRLAVLMAEVSAVLVYQEAAAGALTRIGDMLVAGVPVIGNTIACRSYHEFAGVFSWESPDELEEFLARPPSVPPLPPPPTGAIQRFVDCVTGKSSVSSEERPAPTNHSARDGEPITLPANQAQRLEQ